MNYRHVFFASTGALLLTSLFLQVQAASVTASTLSAPKTPDLRPGPDGFIRRWLVLEPIASNGLTDNIVQASVRKEIFTAQLTAVPRDEEKMTIDGSEFVWHAVDTTKYNLNLFHFATALKKNTSNVMFWVVTVVNMPREMHDVPCDRLECRVRMVGERTGGDFRLWRSPDGD
jgi:hypothetical protein